MLSTLRICRAAAPRDGGCQRLHIAGLPLRQLPVPVAACLRIAAVRPREAARLGVGQCRPALTQAHAPSDVVQRDGSLGGETSLASLSERAGFLPKPEVFDERLKPGFRGGKALFIFLLCNAVPFGCLLYYLRGQRTERAQLSLLRLPLAADDVATEALRVIRTAGLCFFLEQQLTVADAPHCAPLRVDPHMPEGVAHVAPTEPLPVLPQLERNELTDILESPSVPGLGFISFAISLSSASGQAVLAGHRQASLLYMSSTRGAYCTVEGHLSVLSDPEHRRRYWKALWGASFPVAPPPPPTPGTAGSPGPAEEQKDQPPPWMNPEYVLVRLSVDEVSLSTVVDGPQRWEQRRVRRLDSKGGSGPAGSSWALVAPSEPGGAALK